VPDEGPASQAPPAGAEIAPNAGKTAASPRRRATAESMAQKQREISVSEFFMKNRHLLGFDSPARALLTTIKEALDNSLDACEEAGILPRVQVELVELAEDRFRAVVEDNGPGIVKAQIPKVFGKLLYGSKFHRLRQSRGQQGIGISAAGMYGQLTTGKPIVITSRTAKGRPAHHFEIVIDATRNMPNVVKDETIEWDRDHGTRVEIELQGTYKGGRRSVDEYVEQVAIANPHAEIVYQPPKGRPAVHVTRVTNELPREPLEIQPHPYGVELGMLQRILQDSEARTLSAALQGEFSRVTPKVAAEILQKAVLSPRARPGELKPGEIERLHKAIPQVKIFAPPSACVVPIGEDLLRKGLEREIKADFYTSATRPPAVYRGNPFQVEVGLAYGGSLRGGGDDDEDVEKSAKQADAQEGPITLLRLANRVPLQYQQSSCAMFKAAVDANWRGYGLSQPRGSLPQGPMVLILHMASVWVPFTSESKEAVAHYPEILKEMTLALQECGRRLGTFLRKREAERNEMRRRSIFEMYVGELVESLGKLTPVDRAKLQRDLLSLVRQHTGDGDEDAVLAATPSRKVTNRDAELTSGERAAAGATGRKRGGAGVKAKRGGRGAATPQLDLLPDEEDS
jgi:DNA topoisomerase-6 subunit B